MRTVVLLMLTLGTGCATLERTAYLPIGAVQGADTPFPATPYGVAGDFDKGMVQVMAMDGERLPVGPDAPEMYLHLRLLADNRGDDTPWLFNPNDQLLGYHGGMLAPAYSRTSAGRPVLALGRGSRGWIDLYYPLPGDADPLRVTLWWRVRHGGAIVPERTDFVRLSGRDAPVEVSYALGDSALLPSGTSLGWWWPDYCFQVGGGHRSVHYARPTGYSPVASSSDSSSGSSSGSDSGSSSSGSSESAGSWRNPGSGESASSSSDSSKSAWRR
jgi:hypothetical protein